MTAARGGGGYVGGHGGGGGLSPSSIFCERSLKSEFSPFFLK